jgi:hypothetical protein
LGEVGVDPPIVNAIGVGQRASRNFAAKAGMIQLRSQGAQASFDVSQTFPKRELCEGQAQELIAAREATLATSALIRIHASVEFSSRQKLHELRKHETPVEHNPSSAAPARKNRPCQGSIVLSRSSRVHALQSVNC